MRIVGLNLLLAPALVASGLGAAPAIAAGATDGGAVPGGFTFHMEKPPAAGAARRITVQIDPAAQARWIANAPEVNNHNTPGTGLPPVTTPDGAPGAAQGARMLPAPGPRKAAYAWFWNMVSPALGAGQGRLATALAALTGGPGGQAVSSPARGQMQALARAWGGDILKATAGTGISPALVLAVMGIESGGRADALSPKGAQGLMQLIPATAGRFGVDATDPAQNIKGAVAYLDWLRHEFSGDPLMMLAAYNAGENAVKAAGGVPPYAETRDYVPKVLAAWTVARGLCQTPPQRVADGCVFRAPVVAGGPAAAHRPPPAEGTAPPPATVASAD